MNSLAKNGVATLVIDNVAPGPRRIRSSLVKYSLTDIRDAFRLSEVVSSFKPDVIVHLAALRQARLSQFASQEYHDVNVMGTLNVMNAAAAVRLRRFVFSSSCSIFGNQDNVHELSEFRPMSVYAETKVLGEELISRISSKANISVAVLRFFNVIGAQSAQWLDTTDDSLVAKFRAALELGYDLEIYGNQYETPDGTCIREYIGVSDVIEGIIHATDAIDGAKRVEIRANLTTGNSYSVKEMADLTNHHGRRSLQSLQIRRGRKEDPASITSSISKTRGLVGWRAVQPVDQALKESLGIE